MSKIKFAIEDLASIVTFEKWIKENLKKDIRDSSDELITSGKLTRYLEYIREQISEQSPRDAKSWFAAINKLAEFIRVKNEQLKK